MSSANNNQQDGDEEDINSHEREARRNNITAAAADVSFGVGNRTSSIVPNLASLIDEDTVSNSQSVLSPIAATLQSSTTTRTTSLVPNLSNLIEGESNALITPTVSPVDNNNNNNNNNDNQKLTLKDPPSYSQNSESISAVASPMNPVHARYHAVGLIVGEDVIVDAVVQSENQTPSLPSTYEASIGSIDVPSTTEKSIQNTLDNVTNNTDNNNNNNNNNDIVSSVHVPESEDAVRERFRAANVALDGISTHEDEEQQLKNREREERDLIETNATTKSSPKNIDGKSIQKNSNRDTIDKTIKSKTKMRSSGRHTVYMSANHGLSSSQHDVKVKSRSTRFSSASSIGSSQSELDILTKSRGRSSNSSSGRNDSSLVTRGDSVVISGTSTFPSARSTNSSQRIQVTPGALAVSQGQAERLAKSRLTEHPDLIESQEMIMPLSYATTSPVVERAQEQHSEPMVKEAALTTVLPDEIAYSNPDNNDDAGKDEDSMKDNVINPISSNRWKWICGIVCVIALAAGIGGGVAAAGKTSSDGSNPSVISPTTAPTALQSENFQQIKNEIADVISPSSAFEDGNSPQYKALAWIANTDTISTLDDLSKLTTRYILGVFYFMLDGPNWKDSWQDWLDPNLNECSWEGVICGVNNTVSKIFINESIGIKGKLSAELQHLTGLRELELVDNQLEGIIDVIGQLEILKLSQNNIGSPSLDLIFQMTNLNELDFSDNNLNGTLPVSISSMSELRTIDLSKNDLSGTITTQFQTLRHLTTLYLHNNNFEGQFNELITGLTSLTQVVIDNNKLGGTMNPSILLKLQNLQRLEVSENNLNGPFPNVLWDLPKLAVLDLGYQDDGLTGTISSKIGNATELEVLQLHRNNLEGAIPSEIGNLNQLRELNLETNFFVGLLPSELGNLRALKMLQLSTNFLTSTLPSELGQLDRLTEVKIAENNLSGTIPIEFSNLLNSETWNFFSNLDLAGTIPVQVCNFVNLTEINVQQTNIVCECQQCII